MRYRLKDRELQRKLDEATDGEFSRRLQNDRERMDGIILIGCMGTIEDRRRHNHTKLLRMTLCFAPDEIEEVREYDPTKWNNYPEVEPPEGVWMRVEWRDGVVKHLAVARYEAWGGGKQFVWVSDKRIIREVDRFRPRDNPEDEE